MRQILAVVTTLFAAAPAFAQCSDADKKALEAPVVRLSPDFRPAAIRSRGRVRIELPSRADVVLELW